MESILDIPQTLETPYVVLNRTDNIFEIGGRSLPEDAADFFAPILKWLAAYAKSPNPETLINVKLEYYNSASARKILEIFILLAEAKKNGSEITVNWFYDEDDDLLLEAGEEISSLADIPFNLIAQPS